MMHKENRGRLLEEGMIPVEFISYGVQDIKFTRVFCYILVKVRQVRWCQGQGQGATSLGFGLPL